MAQDPIRPTDAEARVLARRLINTSTFGALAVMVDNAPMVSRIAVATDADGVPLTLISDLSIHTKALRASPQCSLLVGEPGERGDPLTHPRLTLQLRASFLEKTDALVAHYLAHQPKAKLYIGFTDFHLVKLAPTQGYLNGGFGKAYHLTAQDLIK